MEFYRKLIASRKTKTVVFLTLTILYFAGLIAFFMNAALGTILWAAALLPSIIIYIFQKQMEREEKLEKARQEAMNAESEEE